MSGAQHLSLSVCQTVIAEFLITVVSAVSVCSFIRGPVVVRIGPVHFRLGIVQGDQR